MNKKIILILAATAFATPVYAADEIPFPDITCENTATTGTGTVTLTGALTGGYLGFSSQVTSGNSVFYNIVTGTGGTRKVEVGKGIWTSPDQLTRVAAWSSDGAATNISLTGTSRVCIDVSGSYFDQGAGSGLNADSLDSISSTGFAQLTGTPANNQVAVWTGATTIEGDSAFTFDTATDALSISTVGVFTVGTIELGNATDTTIARDSAGVASIESKKIKIAGRQMIYVPAGAMFEQVNPAACGTNYDSGTNDVTVSVCGFDTGATEERVNWGIAMPKSWNLSTLSYQVLWTNTAGLATETVQWEMGCAAVSDGDTLNAAIGTTVTQSDTFIAQNTLHVTAESGAMTCSGTPAQNDWVYFRLSRDTSVDNMTGDALLIGVRIFWTDNAANQD